MDKAIIADHIRPLAPLPTGIEPSGRYLHGIEGVLFDVYGTLFISTAGDIDIDPKPRHQQDRIERLLEHYQINIATEDLLNQLAQTIQAEHARLIGDGIDFPEIRIDDIWSRLLPDHDRDRIRRFALAFEWIVNPVYPMPHLATAIDCCHRAGLKLGLVSNAQFFTPWLFGWFLKADPVQLGFDPELTIYSYEHGYAKPSPRLFNLALKALQSKGLRAASVIVVGNDWYKDILPAHRTGFRTALFAGDARSLRAGPIGIESPPPDLVITDLTQLCRWLLTPD
jgi:putative hydrolase of the HAD superfamily